MESAGAIKAILNKPLTFDQWLRSMTGRIKVTKGGEHRHLDRYQEYLDHYYDTEENQLIGGVKEGSVACRTGRDPPAQGSCRFDVEVRYRDRRFDRLVGKKHCHLIQLVNGMGRLNVVFDTEAFHGMHGVVVLRGTMRFQRCYKSYYLRNVASGSWNMEAIFAKFHFMEAMASAGFAMSVEDVLVAPRERRLDVSFRRGIPNLTTSGGEATQKYLNYCKAMIRLNAPSKFRGARVDEWEESDSGDEPLVDANDDYDLGGLELTPQEYENQVIILNDMDETAKWLEALYNY